MLKIGWGNLDQTGLSSCWEPRYKTGSVLLVSSLNYCQVGKGLNISVTETAKRN
jgi:hypothetical protein